VLELAILGLLKEKDRHGYELKTALTETLGPFSRVSFGSLYPALARLESAGAVRALSATDTVDPPATFPDTGSISGEAAAFRARRGDSRRATPRSARVRKVYGITERGEELFGELLAAESASAEDDRHFNLRLAFCRYLPPEARIGLLERRREQLVARLTKASAAIRTRRDRTDSYTQSVIEHGTETTRRDISWLDTLIAGERRQGGNS